MRASEWGGGREREKEKGGGGVHVRIHAIHTFTKINSTALNFLPFCLSSVCVNWAMVGGTFNLW